MFQNKTLVAYSNAVRDFMINVLEAKEVYRSFIYSHLEADFGYGPKFVLDDSIIFRLPKENQILREMVISNAFMNYMHQLALASYEICPSNNRDKVALVFADILRQYHHINVAKNETLISYFDVFSPNYDCIADYSDYRPGFNHEEDEKLVKFENHFRHYMNLVISKKLTSKISSHNYISQSEIHELYELEKKFNLYLFKKAEEIEEEKLDAQSDAEVAIEDTQEASNDSKETLEDKYEELKEIKTNIEHFKHNKESHESLLGQYESALVEYEEVLEDYKKTLDEREEALIKAEKKLRQAFQLS